MSEKIILRSFPSDASEALAYLHMQTLDLTGMLPEEINTEYYRFLNDLREDREIKSVQGKI